MAESKKILVALVLLCVVLPAQAIKPCKPNTADCVVVKDPDSYVYSNVPFVLDWDKSDKTVQWNEGGNVYLEVRISPIMEMAIGIAADLELKVKKYRLEPYFEDITLKLRLVEVEE